MTTSSISQNDRFAIQECPDLDPKARDCFITNRAAPVQFTVARMFSEYSQYAALFDENARNIFDFAISASASGVNGSLDTAMDGSTREGKAPTRTISKTRKTAREHDRRGDSNCERTRTRKFSVAMAKRASWVVLWEKVY